MSLTVGLITSEFPPDRGGVETYAWQLVKELGKRPGLNVRVYAPHKTAALEPPAGVTIKPILSSCIGLDWPKLKDEPVDVWHALSAPHAWIAEKGVPTVVSVHGNDFMLPYANPARPAMQWPVLYQMRPLFWRRLLPLWRKATLRTMKRSLPRAKTILSNSRYTADVLISRFPECRQSVRVAWVGVDPVFFGISRSERGPVPRLLTITRLSEPRKNVDRVLYALAELKERYDFSYTIAGGGVLRTELEELSEKLGLNERVQFVGRVSDEELRELYATADLFVLTASIVPNSHEGFGIVYLEAAASGLPSLAARLAGAAEAVSDGKSGFFVESTDVPAIRNALQKFLSHEVAFEPEGCRSFAEAFSWSRIGDICEQVYADACHVDAA